MRCCSLRICLRAQTLLPETLLLDGVWCICSDDLGPRARPCPINQSSKCKMYAQLVCSGRVQATECRLHIVIQIIQFLQAAL